MKKNLRWLLVILASAVMAIGGIAMAGCDKVLDHDHIWGAWEPITPATCTENGWQKRTCIDPNCSATEEAVMSAPGHTYGDPVFVSQDCKSGGVMRRVCTVCGNVNDDTKAEARDHAFEEKEVIKPATCKEVGSSRFVCTVCGKEEVQEVAKKPHNNEVLERTNATCTAEGVLRMKCKDCGEETVEKTDPLDHDWATKKETPATCTEKGLKEMVCTRCPATDTIETDALGHNYIVDSIVYPNFDHGGSRQEVCSRCSDKKTVTLEQLTEGQKVEFSVQLYRSSGQKYMNAASKISILKGGKEIASGQYSDIRYGLFKTELEVHRDDKFTVQVSNLPNGYSLGSSEEIVMEPGNPTAEVVVKAKLLNNNDPVNTYYQDTVVSDFTYKTVTGETINLKQLLETHKFVYVDMFFTTCGPCVTTFRALNEVYNSWKDQIAVIAIADSQHPANPDEATIKKFQEDMKIPFYVVYDQGQYANTSSGNKIMRQLLLKDYGGPMDGYPFAFFIDQEGVVARIHQGTYSTSSQLSDHVSAINSYFHEMITDYAVKTEDEEAEKQEAAGGLETAMLRGDYLPVDGKRNK